MGIIKDFMAEQREMLEQFEQARLEAVLDGQLSLLQQLGEHLGSVAWKYLVHVTPDLVGYMTLTSAALMMLSPLFGRSLGKPIGLFAGSFIVGVSILSV